ncbi:protein of unknown function DUF214 [Gloeothece citriformis PCC 7424]|uniref:ABC3 transporter permease protein domain-containing protein n=1 Tax=Gloeothece citriformis (strain PCC 7424) TaxID=65393 RepID=B7KIH4_GLOC7|nr:ABC transporter permease [Gloeothece citriformis]ACK69380.1 protein of unknown function DUF214 [Gloeothece citriformis PCC 7424]
MDIFESLKIATSTLLANKLRTGLTMLGIIIGNASVVTMIGLGQGAKQLALDQFSNLGPNTLFVVPGSSEARQNTLDLPKTLVLSDAIAIDKQVPTVSAVAPEINRRELAAFSNRNMPAQIVGTTPEYATVRKSNVEIGRFINEIDLQRYKRVAVLGSAIAEELFNSQIPIGKEIKIRNISFEVIGVLEEKGSSFGQNQDEVIVIPLPTMVNQLIGKTSPYGIELTWINVMAKDENSVRAAQFQIENLLRLRHKIVGEDDFGVENPKQYLEMFQTIMTGLTFMLAAIAAISLVVGGIGVMNIMLVSVTERTQEIGLRKAIGAREQDILLQFLIEAIIVSCTGGLIGIVIGMGAIGLIASLSPLTAIVSPTAVIISFGVSGGIGLFFGVVPAHRAAKLDPIVALRSA